MEEKKITGCLHPENLATFFSKDKTFTIESHLFRAKADEGESPYANYGAFSHFKITILDKAYGKSQFVEAIITPQQVAEMAARTDFARTKIYQDEIAPMDQISGASSPAYTAKFAAGNLKGKTPAEVMCMPNGKELLNQQYKFLKENLAKYPANKQLMDAISDAAKLAEMGQLSLPGTSSGSQSFYVLPSVIRGLTNRPQKYGKCFVYEIDIECEFGSRYPFVITITNYYATVVVDEQKRQKVDRTTRQDEVKEIFRLSCQDWSSFMANIETNMRQFENGIGNTQFAEAAKYAELNRKAAKEE